MSERRFGDLTGRVALVTGSSRGIGRAIALRLARAGARVVVNYLNHAREAEEVAEAIRACGSEALVVQADVTVREEVARLVQEALNRFGRLDILVNNAGTIRDVPLVRMRDEDWDAILNLDLRSAFLCTREALKPMLKARWGRIINISSVVGLMGNIGQANYAAAKAGLIGLTKSVAREVATRNITVNAVAPGYVHTELVDALPEKLKERILFYIPQERFGDPEDVAHAVAFLASEEARYITGQVLCVDGGLSMNA